MPSSHSSAEVTNFIPDLSLISLLSLPSALNKSALESFTVLSFQIERDLPLRLTRVNNSPSGNKISSFEKEVIPREIFEKNQ